MRIRRIRRIRRSNVSIQIKDLEVRLKFKKTENGFVIAVRHLDRHQIDMII